MDWFSKLQQNGSVTPEKKCPRSRPPSYAGGVGQERPITGGGESPVLRSRSSTCDSLHHAPPTPTTLPRKPNVCKLYFHSNRGHYRRG